ncbi:3'-5' exonuclease [Alkaliphilus sp. B6464]|uniref:3'-5' exonuclease n=1 Tax=Alkaliphilus sp. B6464 TaxID=2731219 RepID=UPI001BA729B4|nr:exonuclease domain-containing protein [Alkaliphilus sp. B6464]QUH22211.1 3'-5' exoribonuclease [Alkaliphilus sp. B6464]
MAKRKVKARPEEIAKIKTLINSNNKEYVVFDIETTGFDYRAEAKIIEIGAVKFNKVNDEYILGDKFSRLINPEQSLTSKIIELTGITDDMLKDQPTYHDVLPEFKEFIGDAVLVAHNASFDVNFVSWYMNKLGIELINDVVDTLEMARDILVDMTSHKLNLVCEKLGIEQESHHRAVDDSRVTGEIFLKLLPNYIDNQIDLFSLSSQGFNEINHSSTVAQVNPFTLTTNNPNEFVEKKENIKIEKKDDGLDKKIAISSTPSITVESISYWSRGSLERIYVNAKEGVAFFDVNTKELEADAWKIKGMDIRNEEIHDLTIRLLEIKNTEELANFRGKNYLPNDLRL